MRHVSSALHGRWSSAASICQIAVPDSRRLPSREVLTQVPLKRSRGRGRTRGDAPPSGSAPGPCGSEAGYWRQGSPLTKRSGSLDRQWGPPGPHSHDFFKTPSHCPTRRRRLRSDTALAADGCFLLPATFGTGRSCHSSYYLWHVRLVMEQVVASRRRDRDPTWSKHPSAVAIQHVTTANKRPFPSSTGYFYDARTVARRWAGNCPTSRQAKEKRIRQLEIPRASDTAGAQAIQPLV
jgi:hypothetical protein